MATVVDDDEGAVREVGLAAAALEGGLVTAVLESGLEATVPEAGFAEIERELDVVIELLDVDNVDAIFARFSAAPTKSRVDNVRVRFNAASDVVAVTAGREEGTLDVVADRAGSAGLEIVRVRGFGGSGSFGVLEAGTSVMRMRCAPVRRDGAFVVGTSTR